MEVVKVNSLTEATFLTVLEFERNKNINLALTGGNFGEAFIDALVINKVDIRTWNIFFTDERLTVKQDDLNGFSLCKKLRDARNFNYKRINFFDHKDKKTPYLDIAFELDKKEIENLNICLLSLGEDGHLAGHFSNSVTMPDSRFCYTDNAFKPPRKRISFNMKWLKKSDKLILAILGDKKRSALEDLIAGSGMHSDIWNSKNLLVLTDLDNI